MNNEEVKTVDEALKDAKRAFQDTLEQMGYDPTHFTFKAKAQVLDGDMNPVWTRDEKSKYYEEE